MAKNITASSNSKNEKRSFVNFKNTPIYYTDTGKGSVVVLIHGFLENSTMWNVIGKELSKKNRVICIDLPGHGNTPCIGYVHTMELLAESIHIILQQLKIRRVYLVGHSLGGYVALAFAEKYSQKVKGICLLNSTSNEDSKARKRLRVRANKMVQKNLKSMVVLSVSNLFYQENIEKFQEEIETVKREALRTPLQGYIAMQEGMKVRKNRNHVLQQNNFKKLLIVGEKDPILALETLRKEAQKTNSEIVVLSGGHMTHIENKEETIACLKTFLKS